MSQCDAVGHRQPRRFGRREFLRNAIVRIAVGLSAALAGPARLPAQDEDGWVGKRIVQKSANFALRIGDHVVDRSVMFREFYRVEQTSGPWLWVKVDGRGLSGWLKADEVVPVELGTEYFTNQIRANPQDVFFYRMRGMLWRNRKELDLALADLNEAIRVDPTLACTFVSRGNVWATKGKMRRPSLITTRPSGSIPSPPLRTTAVPLPGMPRSSSTGPSPITTRPFGSIRNAASPTITAGWPGPVRKISTGPSLITTSPSVSIPNSARHTLTAELPGTTRRSTTRPSPITPRPFGSIHKRLTRTTIAVSPRKPKRHTTRPSPTTPSMSG